MNQWIIFIANFFDQFISLLIMIVAFKENKPAKK
jgi:hypothetical protein